MHHYLKGNTQPKLIEIRDSTEDKVSLKIGWMDFQWSAYWGSLASVSAS